jgi:hypothetical protein
MNTAYVSEDGHEFKREDFVLYATWQIQNLRIQGYSEEEILFFDDNPIWYEFAQKQVKIK